jgi:eukaryotic-like serine/threonine-protein kinase
MSPDSTDHPPADRLRAYGDGRLPPDAAAAVEDHLAACEACCRALEGAPTAALIDRLRAHPEARDWFDRPPGGRSTDTANSVGSDTAVLPAGTRVRYFGDYELLGEIAHGGMGVVYRAADPILGREVAVKVLSDRFAPDSAAARRFTDEARIAGQLQHPGIPAVHAQGTLPDGRPFLVMKLVGGRTLDELLKDRPDPAADRARFLAAFEQVAQAVAYAHSRGVIHRDLKPHNVMVGTFGEVQVMDWGLAKVLAAGPADQAGRPPSDATGTGIQTTPEARSSTQIGSVLGTPAFMPPEQAGGEIDRLDRRADVFGLGAVLCVILTGRPPYVGGTADAVRLLAVRGQLGECFARLDACRADPELVDLCKRCLAPDRDARPRDAGAVAAAVAAYRAEVEGRARRAEVARAEADARAAGERKRRRAHLALAAAVGLMLAGGAAVAWWQDKQAAGRRAQAARNADALGDLLARCEQGLRAGDADRAAVALAEIDRRLPEGGGSAAAARADRCRADLAMLRELDDIDAFWWTPVDSKYPSGPVVAARWRAAFAKFGLAPGETPAAEAAAAVAESLVHERLLTALDLWLESDPAPGLRDLLRAADPDPYRDAVRAAAADRDRRRVAELAERKQALEQPPWFAAALGRFPSVPAPRRRAVLRAALPARPGDPTLLMGLGTSYPINQRDGADERARWFQAAVAARPGNPMAHYQLGVALHQRKDPDGAVVSFREAIRLDPTFAQAHSGLGIALREQGDLAGAVAEQTQAARLGPNMATVHLNLALDLADRKDLVGAIAAAREAVRLDPGLAPAHNVLGRALRGRGDVDGAIAACRKAIQLDPNLAPAHDDLGVALAARGDADGAFAEFQEAVRLDPTYASAHNNLGIALRHRRDEAGATARFREAIRLDPKLAPAHANLGAALRRRGDIDGAVAEFREALRLDPDLASAHSGLGAVLAGKGDLPGAVAEFRTAVRLDPREVILHANLGQALRDSGDLDGAAAAFRDAARLNPKAPDLQFRLRQVERWRELARRLGDVAAGRDQPASPAESCEFAELATRPFQRRYLFAVRLYQWALTADPALAARHRYNAACAAAQAAAGRDTNSPALGVDEWGYVTELALGWLRADLAALAGRAGVPKDRPAVRQTLAHWKQDADLITVRDQAWLTAMPEADRKRWQALWADVDALLGKVPE